MKKILLVVAIVMVAAIAGNAQDKKWNIGVGGGLAMPTGDASDILKTGFDGFINGTYNFTPKFAAGVEFNYTSLPGKTIAGFEVPNFNLSAYLFKGVYTFTEEGFRPYVAVDLGWYKPEDVDAEFGYAGEVGAKYNNFNLGFGYHVATSDFKFFQINVGYTFNF